MAGAGPSTGVAVMCGGARRCDELSGQARAQAAVADRGRGERGRGEQRSLPWRAAIVAAASGHQGRDVRGRG